MNTNPSKFLTLLGCACLLSCSAGNRDQRSHDLHVFKGSFAHLGPPIEVSVSPNRITRVEFPRRISEIHLTEEIPVRISKDESTLLVQAMEGLDAEATFRITTVEGRQYKIKAIRAAEDSPKARLLLVSGSTRTVEAEINPRKENLNDEAVALFNILLNDLADTAEMQRTISLNSRIFRQTGAFRAVIRESIASKNYIAHKLELVNLRDKDLALERKMLHAPNVLKVLLSRDSLPAGRHKQNAGEDSVSSDVAIAYVLVSRE